ncbi:MAG: hypothetical protein JWO50_130 [Candidatus Kaiserbacteria bacterium]|nr:hypothetical protein [Candidatus Kaiserbacteria bacterium]
MWTTERSQVTSAAVLALGFVLAAIIAAYTFYSVHTLNNTIVVTGSATRDVTADGAKWSIGVTRNADVSSVSEGKTALANDSQSIVRFLMANGIASSSIEMSPVFANENYDSNSQIHSYNIRRDITVDSTDPQLIKKLADKITSVTAGDSVISAQTPEYYVSDLATVRVELIADAVKDAAARAGQIAKSTGQKVGALQSASSGVVQVLAPHSGGNVSDYGTYDTSTIEKTVMVTTHATFYLR